MHIGVTTANLTVLRALAPLAGAKIVHLLTDHGKGGEQRELKAAATRRRSTITYDLAAILFMDGQSSNVKISTNFVQDIFLRV